VGKIDDLAARAKGNPLAQSELADVHALTQFEVYDRFWTKGVLFRSTSLQRPNAKFDNTGVMVPFLKITRKRDGTEESNTETAYGSIVNIFVHRVTVGAPARVLLEIEWKTVIGSLFNGRMPRVKVDRKSAWNLEHRYEFADKINCQNVVFWPRRARMPTSADEVAIFRECRARPLERS
jgi:hypothetical protein